MKKIELISLTLRNFKGIRDFRLDADGEDVNVFGDNAVGKTTLFDAFTWSLFDKDSQNKKDFEIKTLGPDGKVLEHGTNHEVEVVLLVNGKRRTLRKVFSEKWTKKRGAVTAEFTGHTTDYYVDGVPVKKGEYEAFIASIVKEEVFKLLTNPAFFNEQLKKDDRRRILIEVCGDLSDAEVITSNPELSELTGLLGERTLEGHRKMLAARRSEINKELDKIPVRIDEAQRAMPDVAMLNADALDQQITSIKEQVEAKQAELIRIQSGGEIAVKEKRLREIEGELLTIKNDAQAAALQAISAKRQAAEALTRRADDLVFESQRIERRISENTTRIEAKKAEADRLRAEWRAAKAETFEGTHTQNTCPACGQQLPAERIAEAHRKALEAFNMSKASRLEEINRQGKATKDEIEQLVLETEELAGKLEAIHADLEIARREADAAKQELERAAAGGPDVENHPEYAAKLQEKAAVEREILGLRSSVQGTLETLRAELAKLRTELELLERDKAKIDQVEAGKRRIAELKQQEKVLAAEFEGLERQLWLTEEFIRTKVTLLESKINSKFRYARFKLFEQQINGGLEETCETLYNGVPYSSGLNRAAQINVGLDIINTLSQHYGFVAPIFIDNAEAVTELAETAGQQIRLIVSKGDKQLRIERANQTAQEATLF